MNQQLINLNRYRLTITGMQVELATLGHVLYHLNRHETAPGILPRPAALADVTIHRDGKPMTIIEQCRPSGRVFGIRSEGGEQAALLQMIDEIDQEIVRIDGVQRAPHEMSYFDWMAVVSVGSAAYNVFPCFPGETDSDVDFMTLCTQEYFRRFGHGHNGPSYDGTQTNSRHEVHVAYALMNAKPVPEYVVEWYRQGQGQRKSKGSDLGGFEIALAVPELRGALKPEQFRFLALTLRGLEKQGEDVVALSAESLKPYAEVLSRLGAEATYVEADNALTAAGLLKVEGLPETLKKAQSVVTSTLSEAARELYAMLADAQFESYVKRQDDERGKGLVSEREYARRMEIAKHSRATASPAFAIEMAEAIEKRDVKFLLSILDQADGNETSKAFMSKRYGLKLKGLNKQKRREAIFSFCGFSAEQQMGQEAALTSAKNVRLQNRAAEEATERAEGVNVSTPTGNKTMRQFVDDAVAKGFNKLIKYRLGKFQWGLFNPETKSALGLSVAHGGLAYARDALQLPVHTQAA